MPTGDIVFGLSVCPYVLDAFLKCRVHNSYSFVLLFGASMFQYFAMFNVFSKFYFLIKPSHCFSNYYKQEFSSIMEYNIELSSQYIVVFSMCL